MFETLGYKQIRLGVTEAIRDIRINLASITAGLNFEQAEIIIAAYPNNSHKHKLSHKAYITVMNNSTLRMLSGRAPLSNVQWKPRTTRDGFHD